MGMENEGLAGRTRPQIVVHEAALRRGGAGPPDAVGAYECTVGRMVHAICGRSMRLCISTWPNQMCAATRHVRQTHVDADMSCLKAVA